MTTPSGLELRRFVSRYIQQYKAFIGFAPYASDGLTVITTAARRARGVQPSAMS